MPKSASLRPFLGDPTPGNWIYAVSLRARRSGAITVAMDETGRPATAEEPGPARAGAAGVVALAVAAVALILAGCSQPEEEGSAADPSNAAPEQAEDGEHASDAPGAEADAQAESAIEDDPVLAAIWAQEMAIEECMRDKGFEYVAFFDPADVQGALEAHPELADRQPIENPNEAILASLSEAERPGYFEAYWGNPVADSPVEGCAALAPGSTFGLDLFDFLALNDSLAGQAAGDAQGPDPGLGPDSPMIEVGEHGSCSYFNWSVAREVEYLYEGSPTAEAIFEGDAAAALAAFQADPFELSPRGDSALTVASMVGCMEIMASLVEHGADPNERHPAETPLRAAVWSENPEAVRLLLDLGAFPEWATARTRDTPLHTAAYLNSTQAIAMLLDAGAALNPRDEFRATPMTAAANGNAGDAARMLLDAGADLSYRDVDTAISVEALYFVQAAHEAGALADLEPPELTALLAKARDLEFFLPGAQDAIIEILEANL